MTNLSISNQALLYAVNRGYKVNNGEVISPYGKTLKLQNYNGYLSFSVRGVRSSRKVASIRVHRLVAYQKYGNKIFEPEIVVRHLNGNSLDNREENIEIGTQLDNVMDRKSEDRMVHSIKASTKLRKFTDEIMNQIRLDRKAGMSYKDLMKKYNISSKGSMSYMINNPYSTSIV